MVAGLSWVTDLFSSKKHKSNADLYKYELDNSREGLDRLIMLTKQLDEMDSDIRNYEGFLDVITNSLGIPIWVKDINSRFLYLNEICANDILNTTVDKAMNLTDSDFEGNALAQVCIESDKKVLESLTTIRTIEHARYADRDIWLDVVKSPIFIGTNLVGVSGRAKNITSTVPIEIRDRFSKAGSIVIDIDSDYCIGNIDERRKNSLVKLLEKKQ